VAAWVNTGFSFGVACAFCRAVLRCHLWFPKQVFRRGCTEKYQKIRVHKPQIGVLMNGLHSSISALVGAIAGCRPGQDVAKWTFVRSRPNRQYFIQKLSGRPTNGCLADPHPGPGACANQHDTSHPVAIFENVLVAGFFQAASPHFGQKCLNYASAPQCSEAARALAS